MGITDAIGPGADMNAPSFGGEFISRRSSAEPCPKETLGHFAQVPTPYLYLQQPSVPLNADRMNDGYEYGRDQENDADDSQHEPPSTPPELSFLAFMDEGHRNDVDRVAGSVDHCEDHEDGWCHEAAKDD